MSVTETPIEDALYRCSVCGVVSTLSTMDHSGSCDCYHCDPQGVVESVKLWLKQQKEGEDDVD